MTLTPAQAARVYDRIGRVQDWQAFYEDRAVDCLLERADLGAAGSVLEFGCGTGRLAARMMPMLPATASYLGLDVSARMVALTSSRLSRWTRRAQAQQTDGTLPLPVSDRSVDLVISTYVFDLLDEPYAEAVLDEFARILRPDGRLCLASLAFGVNWSERLVSAAWNALWRLAPRLVGGCRPIRLAGLLERRGWQIRDRRLVHAWGLVTEIVIAAPPDPRTP